MLPFSTLAFATKIDALNGKWWTENVIYWMQQLYLEQKEEGLNHFYKRVNVISNVREYEVFKNDHFSSAFAVLCSYQI